MLKNKFARQTISFLTFSLISGALYLTAQAGQTSLTWILLGLLTLSALLTLMTK